MRVGSEHDGSMDGTEFLLRMALIEDVESLAHLRWNLCKDDALDADPFEKLKFIEAFKDALPKISATDHIVHFVAEIENTIVSALSVVKVPKIPSPDDLKGCWGYLTNVYTLPEFRNKRIGTALLAHARYWAESQQMELLVVWPSDRSYPFYERAGFCREQREQDPLVLILGTPG